MGRNPKPTALKKLQGTFRKDRSIENEVSFTPVEGIPEPPKYFGDVARREWLTLLPELKEAGTLESVDLVQLRLYCLNIQIAEDCSQILKKEGLTQRIKKNRVMQDVAHPCLKIMNDAIAIINRIAGRFGFDPASRTKVPAPM